MIGVPPCWTVAPLSSVTEKIHKRHPVDTGRSHVRYIDIGSVDSNPHGLKDVPEIASMSAPSRCRQIVSSGDTLFSTVRPYLEKVAQVDASLDGEFASTGFCVLRPTSAILPKYLFYFTSSSHMLDQVLPLQKGVSYPAVLDKEVRSCLISYPSQSEQRRIVDVVEDHVSRLDAAVAGLRLGSSRLKAMRLAILQRDVSGPHRSLRELSTGAAYGTSVKCDPDGAGLAVARIPNLIDGSVNMTNEKRSTDPSVDLSRLVLRKGDLLIVRTNGSKELIGRAAVVQADMNAAFASYLIRYQFRPSTVLPEWVYYALESPGIRVKLESLAASSAGQHNLSVGKLDSLEIPCPDLETQARAVDRLGDIERGRHRLARTLIIVESRAEALRRAVLAAAFSGKLTGRYTDDEVIEELAQ